MNKLINDNILESRQDNAFFAYILNDKEMFLPTEYKILQAQKSGAFLKCMKDLYNGKIEFFYPLEEYRPLSEMIFTLDEEKLITIFRNILLNVNEVKNNGFLKEESIDINFEHIYIDVTTSEVKFIYVPIKKHFYENAIAFENELRIKMIKIINQNGCSSKKMMAFKNDLSNGLVSFNDLIKIVRGQSNGIHHTPSGHSVKIKCQLVATNAPGQFQFSIDKPIVVVGKNPQMSDQCIGFSPAISRKHCQISNENGRFYVTDLTSANGTFLNGNRLHPNVKQELHNNDILKLANAKFRVFIS